MADFKDFQKLKWYYQILIVTGVCGGLLGLLWYQILSPIETDIAAKEETVSQLTQQIARSLQQKMQLDQFKKESAELQARLNELKMVLPLEKETDEILRAVQRSASTSALRILRVGPRPIIDHEVYTEWPIDMEVVGTYHNIGAFLDKIRQLPRIVNISALRITSRASEGEAAFSSSVGATYTATTFVYRDELIAGPDPAARPQ
jgi:type IV pilus assembly protein PilO